ncbi:p-loop containing nucleoside triphosphate hydrolase [Diplodia corticola]|uniref:p-loop containing nucleoside triphosphate hydrolase n=1 Tax=Diplodia corticola TaxID=236234 RepID=A0A1J9RIY0_9PEZI|nr:p-loop containing nucleoside triphosphate hydrolase [Diplodia corticola]OJD40425.1 p-loop containing nucleoside triphosphate hydrolase [Diplodia corticola]
MSRLLSVATAFGFLGRSALADTQLTAGCQSFGMDFQGGGIYFQNNASTDPFTFVQEFEGCQADNSTNILVDPSGDQYTCTSTPMQPDDTDELSTCPILKDELVSGAWSLLILSNNGDDGAPIAFERDFSLTVGVQSTVTVTPTITSTTVLVPTTNVSSTVTSTSTTTLPRKTVTVASTTIQKTVTITPSPVVATKTNILNTITVSKFVPSVTKVVKTVTASCRLPSRQPTPDPFVKIMPKMAAAQSIVKSAASAAKSPLPSAKTPSGSKFRYARDPLFDLNHNREQWLQARSERLRGISGLGRRAPDAQPLTVTDQNTSDFITVTSTSTTSAVTSTLLATATITSTVTPAPATVVNGKTYLPPSTVTLATPTSTRTYYTVARATSTKTQVIPVTITTTVYPAASSSACRAHGGVYV